MGPICAHLGPAGTRWAICWPHEFCYLGRFDVSEYLLQTMWHVCPYTSQWRQWHWHDNDDGLDQDCGNSRALAMELMQSCAEPLIDIIAQMLLTDMNITCPYQNTTKYSKLGTFWLSGAFGMHILSHKKWFIRDLLTHALTATAD